MLPIGIIDLPDDNSSGGFELYPAAVESGEVQFFIFPVALSKDEYPFV